MIFSSSPKGWFERFITKSIDRERGMWKSNGGKLFPSSKLGSALFSVWLECLHASFNLSSRSQGFVVKFSLFFSFALFEKIPFPVAIEQRDISKSQITIAKLPTNLTRSTYENGDKINEELFFCFFFFFHHSSFPSSNWTHCRSIIVDFVFHGRSNFHYDFRFDVKENSYWIEEFLNSDGINVIVIVLFQVICEL